MAAAIVGTRTAGNAADATEFAAGAAVAHQTGRCHAMRAGGGGGGGGVYSAQYLFG
jgi:hypothetical protein